MRRIFIVGQDRARATESQEQRRERVTVLIEALRRR